MLWHLPDELQVLLEHENITIGNEDILNIKVKKEVPGSITICVYPEKVNAERVYITFKHKLWFKTTIIDSNGQDIAHEGGSEREIQEMTKESIERLLNLFKFNGININ